MRIRWTVSAVEDLAELRAYIADREPRAAGRVARAIREDIRLLSRFPSLGRPGKVPETRELVIRKTPYIVMYRVRDEQLEILRVLHATRRWPRTP